MTLIARADQVGSLLRPRSVAEAWTAFAKGELDEVARRSVEDAAISASIRRQEDTGIGVITDGEFRRTCFQNGLVEAVERFMPSDSPAVARTWQGTGGVPQEQETRHVLGVKLRQTR